MWTLAAPDAAYFQTHYSRGKKAAENLLGEAFSKLLVVDRLGSYNIVPGARRQFCLPHVIRNFKKMAQRKGIDGRIGQQIVKLLQLLTRIDHRRQKGLEIQVFRRRCQRVRKKLHHLLKRGILVGSKKSRGQCEALLDEFGCLFTFVDQPRFAVDQQRSRACVASVCHLA